MASIGDTVKSIHDGAIFNALDITGAPSIPLTQIPPNDYVAGNGHPEASEQTLWAEGHGTDRNFYA
jgi:hypothetical protein